MYSMKKISEIHTYEVKRNNEVYKVIVDVDHNGYTLEVKDSKGNTMDNITAMTIIDIYEEFKAKEKV